MIKQDGFIKVLKQLSNESKDKFPNVEFFEREQRLIGYRQALRDFAAKFEVSL